MDITQLLFGTSLVLVLLALAGYYGWRQIQTLRTLADSPEPPEERAYFRRQARRRLIGCALMLLLAALLPGWFFFGIDDVANQLMEQGHNAAASGPPEINPEQKRAIRLITSYFIGTMLVFLLLVVVAGFDVLAIRRYRQRHFQKISDDRREMIERQAARLRSQRNGHA